MIIVIPNSTFVDLYIILYIFQNYARPSCFSSTKDIDKDYSRIQLTGDVKKDIDKVEQIFCDRKGWTRIVDCTMAAKQANEQLR